MPKLKSKRKAVKRFRVTKNGKVLCKPSGRRHLMGDKEAKDKRQMRSNMEITGRHARNIKKVLPYG